jgi:hypothetical protein
VTELEIKATVRDRDGFCCVACGMTNDEHKARYGRQLEVHRKTPGASYQAADCETLCIPCHGPKERRAKGTANVPATVTVGPEATIFLREAKDREGRSYAAIVGNALKLYAEKGDHA